MAGVKTAWAAAAWGALAAAGAVGCGGAGEPGCPLGYEEKDGECVAIVICDPGWEVDENGRCVLPPLETDGDREEFEPPPSDRDEDEAGDDAETEAEPDAEPDADEVAGGSGSCVDPFEMIGETFVFPPNARVFPGRYQRAVHGGQCLGDVSGGLRAYGYEAVVRVALSAGQSIRADMLFPEEDAVIYILRGACGGAPVVCADYADDGGLDAREILEFTAPASDDYFVVFDAKVDNVAAPFEASLMRVQSADQDVDDVETGPPTHTLTTLLEIELPDQLGAADASCGFAAFPVFEMALNYMTYPTPDTFFFMTEAGVLRADWDGSVLSSFHADVQGADNDGVCRAPQGFIRDRDFNDGSGVRLAVNVGGDFSARRLVNLTNCGTPPKTALDLPAELSAGIQRVGCLFTTDPSTPRYYICDEAGMKIHVLGCAGELGQEVLAETRTAFNVGALVRAFWGRDYPGRLVGGTSDGLGRESGIDYTGKIWALVEHADQSVLYRITQDESPSISYAVRLDQRVTSIQYHRQTPEQRFYGVRQTSGVPKLVVFEKKTAAIQ